MRLFAICETESDDILRIVKTAGPTLAAAKEQAVDDQTVISVPRGTRDSLHYIRKSTGQRNLRDDTPCTASRDSVPADGVTTVALYQMRDNTEIEIAGPVSGHLTASGSIDITFARPGRYTIKAAAPFPARPKTVVINATA